MDTASQLVQDGLISDINETAYRATGATARFFRPCSLKLSRSLCAELRFLRAVLFYYSLLVECGAKPVRFCANQTQFKSLFNDDPVAALQVLHALRTQLAHSFGETRHSGSLQAISRSWFRQHARADLPANEDAWKVCAQAIDKMGSALVLAIKSFLQMLENDSEMESMKRELRHSIDCGLSRIEVESMVAEILEEHGRKDLSPGRLTNRYLYQWVGALNLKPSRTCLLVEARKLIERTISDIPDAAPFTGKQIMELLGVHQGPAVGELLRQQSALFAAGVKDPRQLLAKLRDYAANRQ